MATKQKSGLYRTKVKIGVDADGKDINKWISGKTKKELEEQRRLVVSYYITGDRICEDKLFGACAVEWIEKLKAKVSRNERSDSTLESYRSALNKDILPVFGNRNMKAIRSEELQDFVDLFSGKSKTKITYITAALDNIFKDACRAGIIDRNPFEFVTKPSAAESSERRALTEAERARVLEAISNHKYGSYIACMFYLGARPGEIRGLQWGDIDWGRGLVHIQRDIDYKKKGSDKVGALKNSKSNRFVPMPPALIDILRPLRQSDERFIFEGKHNHASLSKTTAERMWTELMLECGLVEAVKDGENKYRDSDIRSKYRPLITPHTMRHNYVTMCWENGIDVYTASKLVGHKSIKTTMDIYTHLSEKQINSAIDQVAKMFGK